MEEKVLEIIREHTGKTSIGLETRALLDKAFRHASSSESRVESYERLEFLGDAVIKLVISDYVFHRFKNEAEGFMTRVRSRLECTETLARISRCLGLNKHVVIRHDLPLDDHVLADVFESVMGAIYIGMGFEVSKALITGIMEAHGNIHGAVATNTDYKGQLSSLITKRKMHGTLVYEPISGNNGFLVRLGHKILGSGIGKTKKAAQQKAAFNALLSLGKEEESSSDVDSSYEVSS